MQYSACVEDKHSCTNYHHIYHQHSHYHIHKFPVAYMIHDLNSLFLGHRYLILKALAISELHKNKITKGFCSKYNLTILVYFELFEDMYQAISREKQIKAGSRKSKVKLIENLNKDWKDLYPDICG